MVQVQCVENHAQILLRQQLIVVHCCRAEFVEVTTAVTVEVDLFQDALPVAFLMEVINVLDGGLLELVLRYDAVIVHVQVLKYQFTQLVLLLRLQVEAKGNGHHYLDEL